ncbi:MAG: hypothetical protein K6F30_10540 [Lachnospiraceae bacterium]|nr:hypothetical protein [Lachnospiraceae bacterium]
MANSEDYLDGLLDSITQAKSENESAVHSELRAREERNRRRTRLNPEDDFMSANGLDEYEPRNSSRKNLRRFLSESDYLKEFEDDLNMMDDDEASEYLKEFEEELSEDDAALAAELSDNPAENFLDSVNEKVSEAKESAVDDLENFSFGTSLEEEESEETDEEESIDESFDEDTVLEESMNETEEIEESIEAKEPLNTSDSDTDILSNVADILSGEGDIDLSVENPEEGSPEESLDATSSEDQETQEQDEVAPIVVEDEASLDDGPGIEEIPMDDAESFLQPEFAEDDLDKADAGEAGELPEITEATVQEVPLMDENGDDVDLMDVLGGDGDLMDIGDLLNADENMEELDEARDEFENSAEQLATEGVSLEPSEEEEEGKKGGILGKILGIFSGLFKKDDDEDEDGIVEIGEDSPTMEELAAEDADILSDFSDEQTPVEEDPKEKKKREKEEKKKQKAKEKAEKKKAKEAAKAAKPPKEKKVKPPKEPDNSPKIPMKRIIPFLLLGVSILALVLISGNTIYNNRTINEAKTLYENGSYGACYTKLYGMEDKLSEEDADLMQKAKLLAKLELNLKEYQMAMEQEEYGEALDALVLGTYSYVRNKDQAEKLNITDAFNALGIQIETTLANQFGLTEQQAIDMVNLPFRIEYTKAIKEVLKAVNLE